MVEINKIKPGSYELLREGQEDILHINYENYPHVPSIESDPLCMARTIEQLSQLPSVVRIAFHQKKKYEYNYLQTQILQEIASIYNRLVRQKRVISFASLLEQIPQENIVAKRANLQKIVLTLLKTDPIGAFVETRRQLREEKIKLERQIKPTEITQHYINILQEIYLGLSKTRLIAYAAKELDGYIIGNRDIYFSIFRPTITPDFMYTRLMAEPPLSGKEVDAYKIDDKTDVLIFSLPGEIKPLYHIIPPEFRLSEDKYGLLSLARDVLSEHKPKTEEFTDPERMRETFFNIGKDLITELADKKGIYLSPEEIDELSLILVRYTVGFGLIETLLKDSNIQDININGPIGETPIFIVHQKYEECVTNIIPSIEDGESWASKFRLISARPLDEANPILDTELIIPGARSRVAIISRPLNPYGLGYSLRRHRDKPWTLPLFIENKMLNPLAAGLISFLVDGARSMLIAGTRSSGKTSLLGAVLVEIMRKYRIITCEDTLELPTEALRKLGYNIQPLKVRSALQKGGAEIAADEGIRTSLRMGDSSLIVGEIRSVEALALYEAMRIGALANVVAGTIHGESPYGVFDRVVNDLKVPETSFKATDIIIISNPVRSSDGLKKFKRVLQITEVRKEWEKDPLAENAFIDLMRYNSKTDELEPTQELLNGDSVIIKAIAGQVKDWAGNWDAVWENILLRAKIKQAIVDYSKKVNNPALLEANHTIYLNDEFHRISEEVKDREGYLNTNRIFFEWEEFLKLYIKNNF